MNFSDKTILVTGATRGIGQAILQRFASMGAYVVGTATSDAGAQTIQDYLTANEFAGEGLVLDVTKNAGVDTLVNHLTEQNRMPSILVNNAGITDDDLLLRMSDEAWYNVIETNLNGVFRLTRACIKTMFRARWGRVINVGSVVGSSGNAGQTNYCAAKAGVIGFSKALAQEISSRGITVNVVAPGFIDTDMTRALPDMVKEEMLKRIPVRRFGTPEDVAETIAFLASNGASYINGQTIHVNGGMYVD